MGKELYASSAAAREVWQRADAALGFSLSKLCFEGPEAELTLTKFAQPAIVTPSIAALFALRDALPSIELPSCGAGHSLGEYSALVASGALGFEDAVRLVHLRGQAMQDAVPAGEAAVGVTAVPAALIAVVADLPEPRLGDPVAADLYGQAIQAAAVAAALVSVVADLPEPCLDDPVAAAFSGQAV